MDYLPLEPETNLVTVTRLNAKTITFDQQSTIESYVNNNIRDIPQETISVRGYINDIETLDDFLMSHVGVPFKWSYTEKTYYFTEYSIEYLVAGSNGNIQLELISISN